MTKKLDNLQNDEARRLQQGADKPASSDALPIDDSHQMITMRGDIEQINLADIFQTIAFSKMEGVLRVRNPLEERRVYCANGAVRILVPQRCAFRRLGQRLIRAGVIGPEDLRRALAEQSQVGGTLGDVLVTRELITHDALTQILNAQIAEDLFDLFTWRHGEFEFIRRRSAHEHDNAGFATCVEFDVSGLLLEVARRSDEWTEILRHIGSLDEVPEKQAPPTDAAPPFADQHAVLDVVDGESTYRQLAEKTTLSLFDFARSASDLMAAGALRLKPAEALLALAADLAEQGAGKRAAVLLNTLRKRSAEQATPVIHSMAQIFERLGERRSASEMLLQAAHRAPDRNEAIALAAQAHRLTPYDTATLDFIYSAVQGADSYHDVDVEQVTLDLLDALIESDRLDRAIKIVNEARGSFRREVALLTREARARQRSGDADGAVVCFLRLAEHHRKAGDRRSAVDAYHAALRLDSSRKDVLRALAAVRRTKLGTCIRLIAAALAVTMLGAMGFVWFDQSRHNNALASAIREQDQHLSRGDHLVAHAALRRWRAKLGDCDGIKDLASQLAFAETADQQRMERDRRISLGRRMRAAADALQAGNAASAVEEYAAIHAEPGMASEVAEIASQRLRAILNELRVATATLHDHLPPAPETLISPDELAAQMARMRATLPSSLLQAHAQLCGVFAANTAPGFLPSACAEKIKSDLNASREAVATLRALINRYERAMNLADQARRLEPLFRAAVDREQTHDYETALTLYRRLHQEVAAGSPLRHHFGQRAERNREICRLLNALRHAAESANFETARAHLQVLTDRFPLTPFHELVELPFTITSQPPGARVCLDGRPVGQTPITITHTPSTPVLITLELRGFEPMSKRVAGPDQGAWCGRLTLSTQHLRSHDQTIESAPTELPSSDVVIVDRGGAITRLDSALNEEVWSYDTGDLSGHLSPAIHHGEHLLVGSLDGRLRCLAIADGSVEWSIDGLPCDVSPTIVGRHLAVATRDKHLHLIDLATQRIKSRAIDQVADNDLVSHQGAVFILDRDGTVTCWSTQLTRIWSRQLPDIRGGSMQIAANVVVVGDDVGRLVALDASSGDIRWAHEATQVTHGPFAIHAECITRFAGDALLRVRVADGAVEQRLVTSEPEWRGPPIHLRDRIVAAARNGDVHVIDGSTGHSLHLLGRGIRGRILATSRAVYIVNQRHELRCYRELR